jgi:AcrR family transcriptional regulator
MVYLVCMDKAEETRLCILRAAEDFFSRYGFGKTTMAEIAGTCNMSAANIYRFFKNKDEIVAEMANGYFRKVEGALREVLRRPGLPASGRLEAFIVEMLSRSHNLCSCEEKMSESVGYRDGGRHPRRHLHVPDPGVRGKLLPGRDDRVGGQDGEDDRQGAAEEVVFFDRGLKIL